MAYGDEISFSYTSPGDIVAAAVVLPIVGLIAIGLRFYTKSTQSIQVGADDWWNAASLVFIAGMGFALVIGVAKQAVAYPTPPIPNDTPDALLNFNPPQTVIVKQIEFAMELLSCSALTCIKASIIFFYRRIFVTWKRSPFDHISKAMLVIVFLWCGTFLIAWTFGCRANMEANWGPRLDVILYCTPRFAGISLAYLGSDLAIDVVILLMPLSLIWRLQMARSKKVIISGVLLVGSVAVAASIARLVVAVEIVRAGADAEVDSNLTISTAFYWYMIEAGVAQITSCLPTLQSLLTRLSLPTRLANIPNVFALPAFQQSGEKDFWHTAEIGTAE